MIINDVQFNVELIDILIELKNELNANGIELIHKYKEGPTHIQICCPYHNNGQEHRPSAGIRKEDGIFHCFACGEIHTLPEVISHCFGHTDDVIGKFGWQWLLKNFATVEREERKDVELDFRRSGSVFNSRSGSNNTIHRGSFDTYHKNVERYVTEEELDKYRYIHPYMYKRGLTDEIIELFDIGFDADTDCITFPVRDVFGNTLFVARRSVRTKFFNYPEGVEKPLYGLYEFMKSVTKDIRSFNGFKPHFIFNYIVNSQLPDNVKQAIGGVPFSSIPMIVCESMLDALSFWTVGKYAVALNGLGNELQFKQLRELPCREIILATDMDERGLDARTRIRQNLKNTKLISEYFFPKGRKDANDCTKEELKHLQKHFA